MSKIVIYKQYVVKKLEGSKRTYFQTRYSSITSKTSITSNSRPLQKGGVPAAPSGTATLLRLSPNHQARERIHRAMADARLLANPASWGRVADPNPN